jgi:uncharacterized membrane protein
MGKHGALAKQNRHPQNTNPPNTSNAPQLANLIFKAEGYSGPIPPPSMLIQFNQAFPECAQRIVTMAEQQSQHRQKLELIAVRAGIRSEMTGQILGFVIALVAIVGGVFLTLKGKPTEGLASIITTIAALAGIFVFGKRRQKKELAQKNPAGLAK